MSVVISILLIILDSICYVLIFFNLHVFHACKFDVYLCVALFILN
jgi:hypothetical protein